MLLQFVFALGVLAWWVQPGSAADTAAFTLARRLPGGPIIRPEILPGREGANLNGPSLIRAPAWLTNRLGTYYLCFAHHGGKYIRLAYADRLEGLWKIHEPGTLHLRDAPGCTGHIASPDVHVDDGRWTKVLDRPTSISSSPCSDPLVHEDGRRLYWVGLYGMNRMDMNELVSFGRSWAYAPELTLAGNDFTSAGYDRSQRCYQLEKVVPGAASLELKLLGSKESPVFNPAFRIKHWNARGARVCVDGKEFGQALVGVHRELEGDSLAVFLFLNSTVPVTVQMDRVD